MWHLVTYQRVVVYMLLLVGNHTTVTLALGTLTAEGKVELIAGYTVVQGDDVVVNTTVCLLVDLYITYTNVLGVSFLEAI